MSAKKSGGTGARLKAKNQAMAARMAADGVKRTTCRCPICNRTVSLDKLYVHLGRCN